MHINMDFSNNMHYNGSGKNSKQEKNMVLVSDLFNLSKVVVLLRGYP